MDSKLRIINDKQDIILLARKNAECEGRKQRTVMLAVQFPQESRRIVSKTRCFNGRKIQYAVFGKTVLGIQAIFCLFFITVCTYVANTIVLANGYHHCMS